MVKLRGMERLMSITNWEKMLLVPIPAKGTVIRIRKKQTVTCVGSNLALRLGKLSVRRAVANAAIDRMFERDKIVIFEGPSYRMKGRIFLHRLKLMWPCI
ncbi:MAG: hypothetical protein IPJ71_19340 [Bdellovibrionales bacterium]|nr:hypothetical protein [Bdellovibrionales bacterium]